MKSRKLVFFSTVVAIILLASGFLYKEMQAIPGEEGIKTYPGILVGDPKAPVTIKEYANLLCPACARFHNDTYLKIEKEYILTGKVNFEVFLFPPYEAAQAGLCADKQGKFIAFSKRIYKKQTQVKTVQDLIDFAKQAGLDGRSFAQCLNRQTDIDRIKGWYSQGMGQQVDGTPTFFVGDDEQDIIPGAYDFSIFKDLIETKLNEK